ncbi:MAG: RepB family plasmid replication initiator protein [Bacteroidia bacterium]
MAQGIDKTLFGDLVLTIPMKELVTHDHHKRVKDGIVALKKKDFLISTIKNPLVNGEDGWLHVGFINYSEYNPVTGLVEFEISRKLMPYLLELAKGFTTYNLIVALSLKSEYSQRFYEFCSRFKDTGVWNISVEDLKFILKLDGKYEVYNNFKNRILEPSKKELKALFDKGGCDLYFVYHEKKTGKSVTDLTFKIVSSANAKAQLQQSDDMQYVSNILSNYFAKDGEKPFVKKAMNNLFNKNLFGRFAGRLEQLEDEIQKGTKKSSDLPPLIRHILKADYQIFSHLSLRLFS